MALSSCNFFPTSTSVLCAFLSICTYLFLIACNCLKVTDICVLSRSCALHNINHLWLLGFGFLYGIRLSSMIELLSALGKD